MNDRFIVISPLSVNDEGVEHKYTDDPLIAIRVSDVLTFAINIGSSETKMIVRDIGNRSGYVRYTVKESFEYILDAVNKED